MRYMITHNTDEYFDASNPPPAEFMVKMDAFMDQVNRAGVLLAGEGLEHPRNGIKISVTNGDKTVTDGPYAEAKEVIAGFVMVDVKSMDEAVQWGHRFADCFSDIDVEVRRVVEVADFE